MREVKANHIPPLCHSLSHLERRGCNDSAFMLAVSLGKMVIKVPVLEPSLIQNLKMYLHGATELTFLEPNQLFS